MKRPARPNQVRLIGGLWKRTPLTVVDGPGLRPTPQRVRETVFDWLTHACGGSLDNRSAIDLYAGTGALGFESASRGASPVVLVDRSATAVRAMESVRERLQARQVEVVRGDATAVGARLAQSGRRFDLVFLDPPFGEGALADALPVARSLCTVGGFVYVEAERAMGEDEAAGNDLTVYRTDRAGDVFYHLLRCKNND